MEAEFCSACGADFQGMAIHEKIQHLYGGLTHYSRKIGIYDMELDRTVTWKCPDCGYEWPRE